MKKPDTRYARSGDLILHNRGDRVVNVADGRSMAEPIPGAKYVELDGIDHVPFSDNTEAIVAEIEEFLTGITETVRWLGVEVRAGLHTGECEVLDGKLAGIALPVGARIASLAGPGEVLVSSTVKDPVAGSGFRFQEHGMHELKGVSGAWNIYSVEKDKRHE